jgi:hypothetical protein
MGASGSLCAGICAPFHALSRGVPAGVCKRSGDRCLAPRPRDGASGTAFSVPAVRGSVRVDWGWAAGGYGADFFNWLGALVALPFPGSQHAIWAWHPAGWAGLTIALWLTNGIIRTESSQAALAGGLGVLLLAGRCRAWAWPPVSWLGREKLDVLGYLAPSAGGGAGLAAAQLRMLYYPAPMAAVLAG